MKILIASLVCVICLFANGFAQNRSAVLCKGQPIPEGYTISGETLSDSCQARRG
jgi:hypothetical protein